MSCTWSWAFCDPLQSSHPAPSGHYHRPREGDLHLCLIPGRWPNTCSACFAPGSPARTPGDTVPHHPVDCAGTTPGDRQVESSWWQCVTIIHLTSPISPTNVPWSWVSQWHWRLPALPACPDLGPATYPHWCLAQWTWPRDAPDRSPQGTDSHAQGYNLVHFALKFVCLRRKERNKEWNMSLYIGHSARQWLNPFSVA